MRRSRRILITGAAGFFGHHLVEHVLKNTDWEIAALVRLGRIGDLRRLADIDIWPEAFQEGRVQVVWHDLRSPVNEHVDAEIGSVDYVVHAAASTHVDESIRNPVGFVKDNVLGTVNLLEWARTRELEWFHYFSTDEVYGPAAEGVFHTEDDPYNATNPYSATKAGAEQLVNAYGNTYDLPVFITNTMNLIGERIGFEKFMSLVMRSVLEGEKIYIHADETKTRAGSRHYLHARNAAAATLFLLESAEQRGRYNIVGEKEVDNLTFAQMIVRFMNDWTPMWTPLELDYELVDFHSSRPGHDLRYALDGSKLAGMGYEHPVPFEESLRKAVFWTMENPKWLGLGRS